MDQTLRNFATLIRHFTQKFCFLFDLAPTAGLVEFIAKKESAFSILNRELIVYCIMLQCYIDLVFGLYSSSKATFI